MKAGRKIFFDKITGLTIVDTGQWDNVIREKTIEEQIASYSILSERNRETFDVLELPFGAYAQDFAESNGYRVNPETKALEFSYPDPNEPEAPQVFQKPLSEQIAGVREHARAENLATMDALAEVYEMILGGM